LKAQYKNLVVEVPMLPPGSDLYDITKRDLDALPEKIKEAEEEAALDRARFRSKMREQLKEEQAPWFQQQNEEKEQARRDKVAKREQERRDREQERWEYKQKLREERALRKADFAEKMKVQKDADKEEKKAFVRKKRVKLANHLIKKPRTVMLSDETVSILLARYGGTSKGLSILIDQDNHMWS